MKTISIVFSALFSVSSTLVHASTMLEDHRDSPVPSTFQTGVPAVPQDDCISKLLSQRLEKIIIEDELTEENEKFIRSMFQDKDFETISNRGWEAEQTGDTALAFLCMRLAAIGGIVADQEQLAEHYFRNKNYKNAARWYIRSALNNHSDALALLYRIDEEREIMKYINQSDSSQAMEILEGYWKSQNTGN